MINNKKFIFIEPYYGISGDMFVAALLSLGAGTKKFFDAMNSFNVNEKYFISLKNVNRAGIEAKLFKVSVSDVLNKKDKFHCSHGRTLEEIEKIINSNSKLPPAVRKKSLNLFRKLAEAEKKVHFKKEKIHFHEVGAIDSIIDICGSVLALHILGIEKIYTTPVNIGYGTLKSEHGIIPIPSPAASELLKNVPVFVNRELPEFEFTTPTGALIVSQLCDFRKEGNVVEFLFEKTAYGAGANNFTSFPNILRASICTTNENNQLYEKNTEDVYVIESLFDDATGEELGFLKEYILNAGALDCIILPASGKKNRPVNFISVICPVEKFNIISDIILKESSTNGLKFRREKRIFLDRFIKPVKTPYGPIFAKFAISDKKIIKVKPEHDDIIKLAKSKKLNYISIKKKIESYLNQKFLGKNYE